MKVWAGTSGYSYKEWKGSFYPDDLPDREMLAFYAGRLDTVEINNTFYRMPTSELLGGWAARVPEGFRFVLKASRRITHHKKLRGTDEDVAYLTTTASELGARLGPLLFQLPPYLKKDVDLLADFASALPKGLKAAFEFRNSSWFDDEVYSVLSDRELALVIADTGDDRLPPVIVPTAPYSYARLRREAYEPEALEEWAERLTGAELAWEDVYVFFKHEDAGAGPRLARAFAELAGAGS